MEAPSDVISGFNAHDVVIHSTAFKFVDDASPNRPSVISNHPVLGWYQPPQREGVTFAPIWCPSSWSRQLEIADKVFSASYYVCSSPMWPSGISVVVKEHLYSATHLTYRTFCRNQKINDVMPECAVHRYQTTTTFLWDCRGVCTTNSR